jgi:hypothetical protein
MAAHQIERTGWGSALAVATVYFYAKQYDRVLDCLEAGYEMHEPNMPYIAIIKKMNLPMPQAPE